MRMTVLALALAGAALPSAALAQDSYEDAYTEEAGEYVSSAEVKSGFRIEARGFYERLDDPVTDANIVYEFGNGFGAGVEAGYDFAVGENVTVGPYVTYDFSSLETCDSGFCLTAPEYWAAGLQVGLASGESGLVYGKLGYGQQTVELTGSGNDGFGEFTLDERVSKGGYNFAFGYEHGFGDTVYARGEIGVSESYDIFGFDLQRGLFALALGARF